MQAAKKGSLYSNCIIDERGADETEAIFDAIFSLSNLHNGVASSEPILVESETKKGN